MSTFHRWSCFLIKESTWIRCRDHGVHWAECKTKKKKKKKKEKGNDLSCSFKEHVVLGLINKCVTFVWVI